jgi:hypothetical protein
MLQAPSVFLMSCPECSYKVHENPVYVCTPLYSFWESSTLSCMFPVTEFLSSISVLPVGEFEISYKILVEKLRRKTVTGKFRLRLKV